LTPKPLNTGISVNLHIATPSWDWKGSFLDLERQILAACDGNVEYESQENVLQPEPDALLASTSLAQGGRQWAAQINMIKCKNQVQHNIDWTASCSAPFILVVSGNYCFF